jgi:hypothetical protein
MVINFWSLVVICLVAGGAAYIITGSSAGYIARVVWWTIFRRTPLLPLFFCPSCLGTWTGFLTAFVLRFHWIYCIQAAFATCLFMAVVQQQWGIAASDEDAIEEKFRGKQNG